MIKEVLNRRIPQILGSYIVAATSLVLFMDWLSARYEFPQYYVTIALFGIVSIIPSVLILAYFHGAPGKDEWNKLEKVGIPMNVIFIALMILLGKQYDWWFGNVSMEPILKEKRLLIAKITSNDKNVEFMRMMINKYEGINDPPYGLVGGSLEVDLSELPSPQELLAKDPITFTPRDIKGGFTTQEMILLNKDEKNNIYDELITYLEMNKIREDIHHHTKYQLEEEASRRGVKVQDHVFTYLIKQINSGWDRFLDIHYERMNDEKSMYNYIKKTSSDFGYFPLIYKSKYSLGKPLKGLEHLANEKYKEKYVVFHSLCHELIEIDGEDERRVFHNPSGYKMLERDEIVEYMGEYIFDTIRDYLSVNTGEVMDILSDGKILFKYDKNKNKIKSRMILDALRIYKYDSKLDDFDDFINGRVDDLLTYEYHVDKDTTTDFYDDYYSKKGPDMKSLGLFNHTKNELNMLLNGAHIFFNNENKNIQSTYPLQINIKIKVENVYDSTATAIIYSKDDPNVIIKVGDVIKY